MAGAFDDDLEKHQREIENAYREDGSTKAVAYLRRSVDSWKDTSLNIGVTGRSGVGKSSFINTIRGLDGEGVDAAATGATETTREAMAYPHPDYKNLIYWDLPGIGTETFSRDRYFEDRRVQFDIYDMFLILSNGRFYSDDLLLAETAKKRNKLFLFIRTKVDVDVASEKKTKPSKFRNNPNAEKELLGQIRKEVEDGLKDERMSTKDSVFLIDCLDTTWDSFDFGKLVKRLSDGAPRLKRQSFILSLNVLQGTVLKQKIDVLRERMWKISLASALAVPLPGVANAIDEAVIFKEASFYMEQLGISKDHIETAAQMCEEDVDRLKSRVRLQTVNVAWTKKDMSIYIAQRQSAKGFVHMMAKFVHVVGSIVAVTESFQCASAILDDILKIMESDAKQLLAYMLRHDSKCSLT